MPIRVLPPEIANRIAAGEVVERPASVVKELVENSIDAGARDISVEIQEGGRRLIRVVDDRAGIPSADCEVAFARHATSKLRDVEDLDRILTLGFRGEALASIAGVSRLTLSTCAQGEEVGTVLELDGGRLLRREPLGRPPGTMISVEQLFYNVPARLKFLRSASTEAGHISELINIYALAYPALRFRLVAENRLLFRSDGTGDARDVLLHSLGPEVVRQLISLPVADQGNTWEAGGLIMEGHVGAATLHRPDRRQMIFIVNGRWIKDRSLSYAVVQAYHTLLPPGRFPVAYVAIQLDPAEVDVNVHPTKAEVRFREPGRIFGAVQRQVRAALIGEGRIPSLSGWGPSGSGAVDQPTASHAPLDAERWQKLAGAGARQAPLDLDATANDGTVVGAAPAGRLPILRVVGQIRQMYIIAEGPEGLYLVDQHAAHERVLYEEMRAAVAEPLPVQPLLEPQVVALGLRECGVLSEHLPALRRIGFDVEPFGEQAFVLRAVPALLAGDQLPDQALLAIVEELERGEVPLERHHDARVMAAVCKRAAVKAGQTLSQNEMIELLRLLEAADAPGTCPHGRPTMIHLSAQQLAKQFSRT